MEEYKLIFVGMDMVKDVMTILKEHESAICAAMTDDQKEAYDFGLNTFASTLRTFLEGDGSVNVVPVHIEGLEIQEEFVYEDLIAKILG